ncbi:MULTISPECIES: siderophore-interacting protein [Actinoalloteichus]|uniref:NADPH-dependent ferric siderophore reductase, contains FAD-binding and SIP domains n=1 Tax=Actinoalloteichus caeruleus DSM 43889 TaxID=1120930 RepID=A0ABT1JN05_ACTCY|nr:siderophore-interacting protein [Actinoalloteichus caeruleus]MCP2333909.1 NADPH-dependent ferric siderophore reductase, contains FAD-binding and SIP domains [Actinoalloteichus caeruleus DSM 43889]
MGRDHLRAEVVAVDRVGPRVVRVTFGGPELAGFGSVGTPDEWFRLVVPSTAAHGGDPEPAGGAPAYRAEEFGRWYTVRRWDAETALLTVDLVLHGRGVAAAWAGSAAVGDVAWVGQPRGSYVPPPPGVPVVLAGDLTSLPALTRIVSSLPEATPTRVVVEVGGAADEQPLDGPADLEVRWLRNPRFGRAGSLLPAALREHLPAGFDPRSCRYWMAGEATAARLVRHHLRHELRVPDGQHHAVGYWRLDGEEWNRRFAASGIDIGAIWDAGQRAGRTQEEIVDDIHARLVDAGL